MLTAKELLGRAQALEPQLVEWRRTLHRHPEVGFDLTQTKALVKKALTEMGYEPKDCGKAGCHYIGRTGRSYGNKKQKRNHQSISDTCGRHDWGR